MVSETTEGVRVSVETFYLEERSSPEHGQYAYAYRIRIANRSDRTVQLLRRRWVITDGLNRVTEVEGDGVVGEQPVLSPGAEHVYSSGAVLETPTGTMEGHYEMRDEQGRLFQVRIPLFLLGSPRTLH